MLPEAILARYSGRCAICTRLIRKFTDLIVRVPDEWAHECCAEAEAEVGS